MTQGITKILEFPASKGGVTVRLTVQEVYDLLENRSDVTLDLEVKSSQYYNYIYYLEGSLTVDGREVVAMDSATPTHYAKCPALDTYTRVLQWSDSYQGAPWAVTGIGHNTDGSRGLPIALSLKGYTSGGGGSGWSINASPEVTLTHIPRASPIAATDAAIGGVSMIAVTRRSADYTHTVAWEFGSLSGWLNEEGQPVEGAVQMTASSLGFRLPETFYYEIPHSPRGVCHLTCRTYRDQTPIGEAVTADFTVTADPALCGPQVSGTVKETVPAYGSLTGDENTLIRHASTALCTIAAQGRYGAGVQEKTIAGVQVIGSTRTVSALDTPEVVFACRDSRGYTAACTVSVSLVPYVPLTARLEARRTDPTSGRVAVTVTGNCYRGSFGVAENTLTALCQGVPMAVELTEAGTYTATCILEDMDYRKEHTVIVTVADCIQTLERQCVVHKGIPVFHWGEEDFVFHVPVTAPRINGLKNLALAGYPVGSVFLTLQPGDPGLLLGGTWEAAEPVGGCYAYVRLEDPVEDSALLGMALLGTMILGKE